MKYSINHYIILFVFITLQVPAKAQLHDFDSLYEHSPAFTKYFDSVKDTFDFFNDDEILDVTIKSDFRNLIKKKFGDEYQPATLEMVMFDSVVVRWDISIKPRGGIRREQCYFPPVKLNFSKKQALFRQLEVFDKVKFVGNCQSGDLYDVYLVEEYYIYKMYNLLTPFSYRVRLMKVKYIDSNGKKKPRENYAFIVESTDQLAKRLNGINFEREGIPIRMIDRETSTIMDLFQFMVGNTDYTVYTLHNIKLIKIADPNYPNPVAVPYDFDYSGLINTYYAIPGENWPIEDVTQRYYMGGCREMTEFEEVFNTFREKREAMEALLVNSKYLTDNAKKNPLMYIDEFYKIINSEAAVKSWIVNNCH